MLSGLTVVFLSLCVCLSNHHIIHLKCIPFLYKNPTNPHFPFPPAPGARPSTSCLCELMTLGRGIADCLSSCLAYCSEHKALRFIRVVARAMFQRNSTKSPSVIAVKGMGA